MTDDDLTCDLVEEFLGRLRIGDVPDIGTFIAEHPAAEDTAQLRELLATLLDVERLPFSPARGEDERPLPDLDSCGYRLLKKIGAGGMGVVYEALQLGLDRHVAVKLLRPELLVDPEIRELFRFEARILARFDHPGIVRILETGRCGDIFFYSMELADGRPLDALKERPDEATILRWTSEASDALACAHGRGIVHGDIKPGNLLLGGDGHVRLCDFGLAFNIRPAANESATRGGTLRYMAPETVRGGGADFAGDQYALCASFVEIATGIPFDPDADRSRLFRNPQLAAVMAKGLSADPAGRYRTIGELRDDLIRIRRHEPVTACKTSVPTGLALFCRRHPVTAVAAILATFCLAAVIHGLIRTGNALELAQRNASTANAVIGKVFDEVAELPPTPGNADLLSELIPYYEQIVANPNIPSSELTGALTQLAQTAMRTGDYPLAERTLRQLLSLGNSSANLHRLGYTLEQQGKRDDAAAIFRMIADRYAEGTPHERLDAASALLQLIRMKPELDHAADLESARRLLTRHLTAVSQEDYALFLYAQLLSLDPEASGEQPSGLPSDPLEILDDLSTRNPNNGRFWQAFIGAATDWLKSAAAGEAYPETIDSALAKSDIMLWRFLNRPHTVSTALALKRAHAQWSRRSGMARDPASSPASVDILIRALLNQPNLPEQDLSDLIALSLDALEDRVLLSRPRHHRRPYARYGLPPTTVTPPANRSRRLQELKDIVERHPLPRKDEFLQRIRELEELPPSVR